MRLCGLASKQHDVGLYCDLLQFNHYFLAAVVANLVFLNSWKCFVRNLELILIKRRPCSENHFIARAHANFSLNVQILFQAFAQCFIIICFLDEYATGPDKRHT